MLGRDIWRLRLKHGKLESRKSGRWDWENFIMHSVLCELLGNPLFSILNGGGSRGERFGAITPKQNTFTCRHWSGLFFNNGCRFLLFSSFSIKIIKVAKSRYFGTLYFDCPKTYHPLSSTDSWECTAWIYRSLLMCEVPLILVWHVHAVSATSVLDSSMFCVHELTFFCCFIIVFVVSFFATAFLRRENAPKRFFSIICSKPVPLEDFCTMMKCFCTTCEACTPQCACLLRRLAFAEVG